VLVAAGTFEYGEPVGVGSRHRDTEPSSVGDAITVAFTRPGVGGVRVPAELGDVRLAPDGLGSRQCPVRGRHMPGSAPNPRRRSIMGGGRRAADAVRTRELR